MPRFLADANLDRAIVRGLLRRQPDLDIVRAQELGFERTLDPDLLEWAAGDRRVIVTHDSRTMPAFANARLRAGQAMPGLIAVDDFAPIGQVIEDILVLVACLSDEEWVNTTWFVPL